MASDQNDAGPSAFISRIDGLYVGMLDADEMAEFNDLCSRGLMRRDYGGTGGFLGLAKARAVAAADCAAGGNDDRSH